MTRTTDTQTHIKLVCFCLLGIAAVQGYDLSLALCQERKASDKPIVTVMSQNGVVAADHPIASAAGAAIMSQGGTAFDAAITTLLTLGVVNPFASGIGGGGFCVVRDAKTKRSQAIDFRETAPLAAKANMYIVNGKADRKLSRVGGLAVGVPGEVAGLWAIHQKYGTKPWKSLVSPARRLAEHGFFVGDLLPKRLKRKAGKLPPSMDKHFKHANGEPLQANTMFKRPGLGKLLGKIEANGPSAFYKGEVARAIVAQVKKEGGILTEKDLSNYKVKWRTPVEGTYRGHKVISMPPPSSGGIVIIQALNILERFDLGKLGVVKSAHLIVEALKHSFADRARWLGDADFVKVPVKGLISKKYAQKLASKIDLKTTKDVKSYGSTKAPPSDSGTSHVSIVDKHGNMVACTSTVNTSFGSMVFVQPYDLVLNNEMDDFSAQPGVPNAYGLVGNKQNAVEANKRPLSSMSPTLVLKGDAPLMIAGASGGPTIITGTLLAILRVIDFKLGARRAVTDPRMHHQWLPHRIYMEPGQQATQSALKKKGHQIKVGRAYNSVQIVVKEGNSWTAVSDPRKMGRPAAATP